MAASLYFAGVLELIKVIENTDISIGRTQLFTGDTVYVLNKVTYESSICPMCDSKYNLRCVSHFILLIQKVIKCGCAFRGSWRKGSNRYKP